MDKPNDPITITVNQDELELLYSLVSNEIDKLENATDFCPVYEQLCGMEEILIQYI